MSLFDLDAQYNRERVVKEQSDQIEYMTSLEKKANEFFHAHETLMVRLCEILNLDYTKATDEDVIQKVQKLKQKMYEKFYGKINSLKVNATFNKTLTVWDVLNELSDFLVEDSIESVPSLTEGKHD